MTIPKLPILLVALAAALLVAPSAMAAFPGKNGHIVFQKSKGGLYKDLFVMNANGSRQTDITNTPKVSETEPSFAPDGKRIVFLWQSADYKHAGIGVMNAGGTAMKRIVSGSPDEAFQSPHWTADGKSIVYTRFQGTTPPTHVYIVSAKGVANADGSGLKNLTHAPGFEHDASWGVAANIGKLPKKKGRR